MADTQTSSKGTFVFALAVAGIAGLVIGWIAREQMLPDPLATQPALSSLLAEPATQTVAPPSAAAIAAAESELLQQYQQINLGFVNQLRKYGARLNTIADVAEAEGATSAAQAMRDFGQETDDVIARFDKVAKQ
jgi:hypothetical protein